VSVVSVVAVVAVVIVMMVMKKRKPLFNMLSLWTTLVSQKTHTEISGSVMVVVGLGYAWVGKSCGCLGCVIQCVCVQLSNSYGHVGLRAGPSRIFMVSVVALFVQLLASVLHVLVQDHCWPFPQCDGLVLQVLDSQEGGDPMHGDVDCIGSSSQVRTSKLAR